MTVIGFFLSVISLVVIWACHSSSGGSSKGRVWSSEELEAMNREMVGKSKKECQQILKKYSK